MNIYQALMDDHREIKQLFEELEQPPHLNGKSRSGIFTKLSVALQRHGEAEEQILYVPLMRSQRASLALERAIENHDQVVKVLVDLENMDIQSNTWLNKIMHLHDVVQHHMQEEEGQIFEVARRFFSDKEAQDMAQEFGKAKAAIPMSLSH